MAKKMWFLEKKGGSEDLPERKPSPSLSFGTSWGTTASYSYMQGSWKEFIAYNQYNQPNLQGPNGVPPQQFVNDFAREMPIRDQGDRGNGVGFAAAHMMGFPDIPDIDLPPPRGDEIGGHA